MSNVKNFASTKKNPNNFLTFFMLISAMSMLVALSFKIVGVEYEYDYTYDGNVLMNIWLHV